ncbi:MAG: 50S ribosomal protein L23 [Nanoarchaeota archaeon]
MAEKKVKAVKKEVPKEEPKKVSAEITNEWDVLIYPHLAEKSMNMIELENKLIFVVKRNAKKSQIKEALEKGFNIKVLEINTEITKSGEKKAYAKLHPDSSAIDIATRMGMI